MDPTATNAAVEILTGFGLPGLVIGALCLAVRDLYKRLLDTQEKRINEAADNRAALERNTSALGALTEWVKERSKG